MAIPHTHTGILQTERQTEACFLEKKEQLLYPKTYAKILYKMARESEYFIHDIFKLGILKVKIDILRWTFFVFFFSDSSYQNEQKNVI